MAQVPAENERDQSVADQRRQIDALRHEFRTAQEDHVLHGAEVPRQLHHYTTLDGLLGITSSHSLWASDVRYMNDASELAYAAELISDVATEVISAFKSEVLQPVLPEWSRFASAFEFGRRPFVACFCEEDDLLSQWRGYRAGETGYSLGIALRFTELPPNTYLRKVIYDEQEQRGAVRDVVETWLRTAESMLASHRGITRDDVFPYPAMWALQEALADHHLCFKHPGFEEEREWRLIKLVDVREELRLLDFKRSEQMLEATRERMRKHGIEMPEVQTAWGVANAEGIEIKFRPSGLGLVPYVELPLKARAGVFTERLPLEQVMQGPTPTPELSLESLGMYLQSRGYPWTHTQVKPSRIPLRE